MFSTKGRYAIRFLIDLSEHLEGDLVRLDEVAERQGISKKYLETVVKMLVGAKMVKGASGKGGGYRLLRAPEEYTIREVLEVTEGSLATVACTNKDADQCPRESFCKTLPMWKKFDGMVYDYFENITIADLRDGNV
ncbi:MAG: Rrf2 family transcriptional regulator [Lachnospiraceae bacterium]|nr:Rrf2 family transcriptional regulator [Candidatus Equihabitans merdae]